MSLHLSQSQVTLHQAMAALQYSMELPLLVVAQVVFITMAQVHRADQVVVEVQPQVRVESQLQPVQISTEITAVHPMEMVALVVVALAHPAQVQLAVMVALELPYQSLAHWLITAAAVVVEIAAAHKVLVEQAAAAQVRLVVAMHGSQVEILGAHNPAVQILVAAAVELHMAVKVVVHQVVAV